MLYLWVVFLFSIQQIFSETIETFYGNIEVEEPVLIELIHSPAFERLKHLHQYGVSYYIKSHLEEYNRHAHSLGVFAILQAQNAPLEEQISGLLHDISHTAFSHVGDWVFGKPQQEEDLQTSIHNAYLKACGIEEILEKHGFNALQVSPKRKEFQMLEQSLPNLCADRIDYNIQGAYYQNFITHEEAKRLFQDLRFESGRWVLTEKNLSLKLAYSSLFMTETCWGSALNCVTSEWLADAILQGMQTNLISEHDFHFGIDQEIWDLLSLSEDPYIQSRMQRLERPHQYYEVTHPDEALMFLPFRCRGIDPWIKEGGKIVRLTSIYPELEKAFQKTKALSLHGWPVKIMAFEDFAESKTASFKR